MCVCAHVKLTEQAKGLRDYCRRGCDLRKVVMKTICRSEQRERERVNERERESMRESSRAEMSSLASYATLSVTDAGELPHTHSP